MSVTIIRANVKQCHCENKECRIKGGHTWRTLARALPHKCPACKSRAWNGVKPVGRPTLRLEDLCR